MTPHFQNFHEFIQMGGHGYYVWASYGITFLCLLALIWFTFAERKKITHKLSQQNNKLTNKQRKNLARSS